MVSSALVWSFTLLKSSTESQTTGLGRLMSGSLGFQNLETPFGYSFRRLVKPMIPPLIGSEPRRARPTEGPSPFRRTLGEIGRTPQLVGVEPTERLVAVGVLAQLLLPGPAVELRHLHTQPHDVVGQRRVGLVLAVARQVVPVRGRSTVLDGGELADVRDPQQVTDFVGGPDLRDPAVGREHRGTLHLVGDDV